MGRHLLTSVARAAVTKSVADPFSRPAYDGGTRFLTIVITM